MLSLLGEVSLEPAYESESHCFIMPCRDGPKITPPSKYDLLFGGVLFAISEDIPKTNKTSSIAH